MPELVADRFLILESEAPRIGGLSRVRKASDARDGGLVAVKYVKAAEDELTKKIFEREVGSLRLVRHPGIVRLIDSGQTPDGTFFLALEWIEYSLLDVISERGSLSWLEAATEFGLPLCEAIAHAHLKGVEHRDIKPGNILVRDDGRPVLADFGIGKLRSPDDSGLTVADFRSGIHAPPEHEAPVRYVRDTYSIGVVLVQLMLGFPMKDYTELQQAVSSAPVSPDVRRFLERCTATDPTERPQNGSVLLHELEQLLRAEPNLAGSGGKTVLLRLTNSARKSLVGDAGLLEDADALFLRDLGSTAHAEFRFDHEKGAHDSTVVMLIGDSCRYTCKLEQANAELVVVAAHVQEFEALEAARRRSIEVGRWIEWTTSRPRQSSLAERGLEALLQAIADFYASRHALDAGEAIDEDVAELFDGWLRILQAREELARGDRQPVEYSARVAKGREVTVTVVEGGESDFVGSEWEIHDGARFVTRGEVLRQNADQWTLLLKGRPRPLPARGSLIPHLGPSRVALQRQHDAVAATRTGSTVNPLLGGLIARPSSASLPKSVAGFAPIRVLDADKQSAVEAALGCEDLMVVKGPPGTGKTTFIVELVDQFLKLRPEARVLIVSQTHVAVDNALERLDEGGIAGLVRLGQDEDPRIASSVSHLMLTQQMSRWASGVAQKAQNHMKTLAKQAGVSEGHLRAASSLQALVAVMNEQELVNKHLADATEPGQGLSASLGLSDDAGSLQLRLDDLAEQKADLLKEAIGHLAGDLTLRANMTVSEVQNAVEALLGAGDGHRELLRRLQLQAEWLQRIQADEHLAAAFLQQSRVIAGTCLGFLRYAVKSLEFDLCILDEASKATATEALVPLARSHRAVLVGDERQLPPQDEDLLRRSDLMDEHDLTADMVKETLFQRLSDLLPDQNQRVLTQQYRMIRPIGDLISTCFYAGGLQSPRTESLPGLAFLGKPVIWIDTSRMGESRREDIAPGGSSFVNRLEAGLAIDRLRVLQGAIDNGVVKLDSSVKALSVLLITPYSQQVAELRRKLAAQRFQSLSVAVESVDAVQGREADFAIFSVVRSNTRAALGFLGRDYWRRINVAMSRARFGLVVIGDADFCQVAPGALADVLGYMKSHADDCEIREADRAR